MNDASAIGLILTLAVLLMLSAFFSATETAFTSLNNVRMKKLAEKKKTAALALKLSGNYNNVLSTLLIGNNIVNIAAASLATLVFTFYFGNLGVTLSTVVMTILVLIFGEISPKSLAKERPEAFACFAAWPLYICTFIFAPLNWIFNGWKKLLIKIFRLNKKQPTLTEEEFQIIVTDIKNEGVLNDVEHDLIQNAIKYDETRVDSVMTRRENMVYAEIGDGTEKIRSIFEESNLSRIPVFENGNVAGILYRADFYEMLIAGKDDLKAILKPAFFTDSDMKISALFKSLQQAKQHIALVVESGADGLKNDLIGLITLEDILEELLGEIDDKYDAENVSQPVADFK